MAEDLHYRTVSIRRGDRSIFLQIVAGMDEQVEVRGSDDIIPEATGRDVQPRRPDRRVIELQGWVLGVGATIENKRTNYRSRINELHAILDPTLAPGALTVTSPYMGLASGTATIAARYVNAVWDEVIQGYFRRVSVELECVASPPNWVVTP